LKGIPPEKYSSRRVLDVILPDIICPDNHINCHDRLDNIYREKRNQLSADFRETMNYHEYIKADCCQHEKT
jgi:hypothetical protein